MADRIRVWFDAEANFLEVRLSDAPGYQIGTENDAVMERIDAEGKVISFNVLGMSRFKKANPLVAGLVSA